MLVIFLRFNKTKTTTQQKTHNLFRVDENSIEQCFAAHINVVNNIVQHCTLSLN